MTNSKITCLLAQLDGGGWVFDPDDQCRFLYWHFRDRPMDAGLVWWDGEAEHGTSVMPEGYTSYLEDRNLVHDLIKTHLNDYSKESKFIQHLRELLGLADPGSPYEIGFHLVTAEIHHLAVALLKTLDLYENDQPET
jgi:hypothetical protein